MKITLIAVGKKMPAWITQGYQQYAKRLSQDCVLELIEVDSGKRSNKSSALVTKAEDAKNISKAIPKNTYIIALDEKGRQYSTKALSSKLDGWLLLGKDLAIIIGGADGLETSILNLANEKWSLSELTLPHPLVRVLVAEQLYRAWSLLNNHPYHRV